MRKVGRKVGKREVMLCERCGVAMNRHAAKLVEPRSAAEAANANPALGGLVADVHTCPSCGCIKSLRYG